MSSTKVESSILFPQRLDNKTCEASVYSTPYLAPFKLPNLPLIGVEVLGEYKLPYV